MKYFNDKKNLQLLKLEMFRLNLTKRRYWVMRPSLASFPKKPNLSNVPLDQFQFWLWDLMCTRNYQL